MPVEQALIALARRQHGVVSAAQLADIGCGRHWIAHRVAIGWLQPAASRRLRRRPTGSAAVSAAMAAVLACGDGALLSHYPAAVLWALRPPPTGAMHVTVMRDVREPRRHPSASRERHSTRADVTRRHGIPVTSPARTLLDVAASAAQRELNRAVDEARVNRLVTDRSLNEQCSRYPTHRGTAALKTAIRTEPKLTRSEAERRLLELIRAARLPEPRTNVRSRPPRGRLPLARPPSYRRGRRLRVPLRAPFVRARPAPGRRAGRHGVPRDPHHVAADRRGARGDRRHPRGGARRSAAAV